METTCVRDKRMNGIMGRLAGKIRLTARLVVTAFLVSLGFGAGNASAHVRWFVDADSITANTQFGYDYIYGLMLIGAIVFAAACFAIERYTRRVVLAKEALHLEWPVSHYVDWRILSTITGLMLIVLSIQNVFLAPNLELSQGVLLELLVRVEFLLGIVFLIQFSFFAAGTLTLVALLVSLFVFRFELMIDYVFEFGGVIIAFFVMGPQICAFDRHLYERFVRPRISGTQARDEQSDAARGSTSARWTRRAREHLAVVVLRSALGLQLAEEAIHNKLMNPDLGLKFLEDNSYYNFMQLLGFSEFSNLHFVFAAALAEITLAMLLIFGIATRFIVIILTGIFLITFALSGLHDLLGHLPIMAVLLLLLFGAEEGRTRPARAGQLGGTSGAA